ncbi:hypothetical protein QBC40DRAFT_315501 [Triangularia verruculosa]|uniref:Uncharacterized protein n=1 Tax=Triangularia verruculosa TaxID=2587418 RepID=A0AAN6X8Q3_9PEZI|nr:hypothetical protein QBC40DRAFT_315501 [Triangularia verruculosa]
MTRPRSLLLCWLACRQERRAQAPSLAGSAACQDGLRRLARADVPRGSITSHERAPGSREAVRTADWKNRLMSAGWRGMSKAQIGCGRGTTNNAAADMPQHNRLRRCLVQHHSSQRKQAVVSVLLSSAVSGVGEWKHRLWDVLVPPGEADGADVRNLQLHQTRPPARVSVADRWSARIEKKRGGCSVFTEGKGGWGLVGVRPNELPRVEQRQGKQAYEGGRLPELPYMMNNTVPSPTGPVRKDNPIAPPTPKLTGPAPPQPPALCNLHVAGPPGPPTPHLFLMLRQAQLIPIRASRGPVIRLPEDASKSHVRPCLVVPSTSACTKYFVFLLSIVTSGHAGFRAGNKSGVGPSPSPPPILAP